MSSSPRRAPPRISGLALRTLATLAKTAPGAAAARALFRRDLRIDQLDRLPEDFRGGMPISVEPVAGRPPREPHDEALGPPAVSATWPRTHLALAAAYLRGDVSPREITERAFEAARSAAAQTPSMGPLMLYEDDAARRDAAASEARHHRGASLGPLDGVPVVVKEQFAVVGLPSRLGTSVLPNDPLSYDATIVARLRGAGAIILGHTPMTEYGLSPLGVNPHRRMPRNPHAQGHVAGGSSTGSGVAVAEGIAPLGVAADGGGSIRIPACLNGVFGIKPTFGRVSRFGDAFGGTVNHSGPIGASTADLAAFLDVVAGFDSKDSLTAFAPPTPAGSFTAALGRGVRGLRIGVLEGEWEDASAPVAAAGRLALAALEREGATLVPLRCEFARFAAPIGYIVIAVEAFAETRAVRLAHFDELGLDLQTSFSTVGGFSVAEYSDALRLRTGLRAEIAGLLRDVDLLALPSTVTGATAVTDDEATNGFVDPRALDAMCRFAFLGNLTGLPAITCPVGVDPAGLPVGLQLVGDAWDEATLLGAAAHLERIGASVVRKPACSWDLLGAAR